MDDDGAALERLVQFLAGELRRGDLPEELRDEYEERLRRADRDVPPRPETPIEELPLHPRAQGYLRRAGIATAGELAALSEEQRAALPYMGPRFLREIRAALGE